MFRTTKRGGVGRELHVPRSPHLFSFRFTHIHGLVIYFLSHVTSLGTLIMANLFITFYRRRYDIVYIYVYVHVCIRYMCVGMSVLSCRTSKIFDD